MLHVMLIQNKTVDSEEMLLVVKNKDSSAEKWKKRQKIVYIHVLFENLTHFRYSDKVHNCTHYFPLNPDFITQIIKPRLK